MNKLQTEAVDRNTECAPMEPEFRVLPDLGGKSVRPAANESGCEKCLHTYCLSSEICRHCGDINGIQGWKGGKPQAEVNHE